LGRRVGIYRVIWLTKLERAVTISVKSN
jgi:hypothetical protein